ncbi:MAG: hypothetical protein GY865_02155 [candidate division Zixibacteria bacterium]|nr:hypothetical protein [candidate division Zixibacteria bacterium]
MNKMKTKKKIIISIILVCTIALITSGLFIFIKDFSHFESKVYSKDTNLTTELNVLVVCYSRNGNTEAMAKVIAEFYNADLRFIESEFYDRDFNGWYKAGTDAKNYTETPITPETIEMAEYDLIFLGSPIWLFRPAPPLWRFVRNNDFTGKNVVLFNTFNSRFKQENIDKFSQLLASNGGTLIDHLYIRRGRAVPFQKDGYDVIDETKILLNERSAKYKTKTIL